MQQPSLLMQLLQLMDNLYVVAACVVAVIGVRMLWVRHRRAQDASVPATELRKDKSGKKHADEEAPEKKKDITLEIIDTLLIALILVFGLVRPLLLQTFFIPSESMVPTLLVHDKLIANKFVYHFRTPERGQVVVFQPPIEAVAGNSSPLILRIWLEENPGVLSRDELNLVHRELVAKYQEQRVDPGVLGQVSSIRSEQELLMLLPEIPTRRDDYIKRVIGQPGDHIRIHDGRVYVNGEPLAEPYLSGEKTTPATFATAGPRPHLVESTAMGATGAVTQVSFNEPFLPWVQRWYHDTHLRAQLLKHMSEDGEVVVPAHAVFVMGDNRSNSFDSRFWGVVPLENVKARAVSTFWPLNRLKLL